MIRKALRLERRVVLEKFGGSSHALADALGVEFRTQSRWSPRLPWFMSERLILRYPLLFPDEAAELERWRKADTIAAAAFLKAQDGRPSAFLEHYGPKDL